MAYGVPWTEGAPVGASTPADTIDTELQNLKISIRERLEDLIDEWTVDGTDPKVFNVAAVLAALGTFPKCVIRRSSDQAGIATGTWVVIDFESEVFDVGDMFDSGVDDEKIFFPDDGFYVFFCQVRWEAHATGFRTIQARPQIAAGGSKTQDAFHVTVPASNNASAGDDSILVIGFVQAEAGDAVDFRTLQTSGGALDILGSSSAIVSTTIAGAFRVF